MPAHGVERIDPEWTRGGQSLRTLSQTTGITTVTLAEHCRKGTLIGAKRHPLTKEWWVWPPAKIVRSRKGEIIHQAQRRDLRPKVSADAGSALASAWPLPHKPYV